MSGSYYALNAKYNQLLALIQAGGGGGGSGVQNPMTSDLDGGGFDITNVATFGATDVNCVNVNATTINSVNSIQASASTAQTQQNTSGGNMFSNGYFAHGGAGATDFGVGGTDITFAPQNTITVKDFALANTYFEYDQTTQTLETKNGGGQKVSTGSVLDIDGGDFLVSQSAVPTPAPRNLCSLDAGGGDYLQHHKDNFGSPQAIVVSTSNTTIPFYCPDVGNAGVGGVPFNSGTSWDSTSDGLAIITWLYDPMLATGAGTIGVGQAGDMRTLYAGHTTGVFCKVNSPWTFTGGATVRLQVGGLLPSLPFTNIQLHSETYPYNRWVSFPANSAYEGGAVRLVLNIPAGGSIDTNGFNFFDGYKSNITNITC